MLRRINRLLSSPKHLHRLWSQPLSRLACNRNRVSFPGSKRPGREVDHPNPSGDEVMNAGSYNSTPPYAFMACTEILPERCSILLNSSSKLQFFCFVLSYEGTFHSHNTYGPEKTGAHKILLLEYAFLRKRLTACCFRPTDSPTENKNPVPNPDSEVRSSERHCVPVRST